MIVCCRDAVAPGKGPPGLTIVAGDNVSDTAMTVLPQALIVEVRDASGLPISGAEVRFTGVRIQPQSSATETLARVIDGGMSALAIDTTDGFGRARVQVELGARAESARLGVNVPSLSVSDTARFTVLPGNPHRVLASAQDTTVTAGGTLHIGAQILDRWGNVRDGPLVFVASPGVTVSGAGDVTTSTPVRSAVAVSSGTVSDTTYISVVPEGTLAAVLGVNGGPAFSLVTMHLDGTGLQTVTTLSDAVAFPSWHPSGDSIVIQQPNPGDVVRLFVVDMQGHRHRAVDLAIPVYWEHTGRYSPDGQWLYFDAGGAGYRAHADGTNAEQIPRQDGWAAVWGPDVSPDGVHLATSGVIIENLTDTTMTRLPVAGVYPRYSPDGTRLLYNGPGGSLSIVNADGTGARELVTTHGYDSAVPPSWSPDGKWILIRGPTGLELVRVSNGEIIPLPYSAWLYQPSMRP